MAEPTYDDAPIESGVAEQPSQNYETAGDQHDPNRTTVTPRRGLASNAVIKPRRKVSYRKRAATVGSGAAIQATGATMQVAGRTAGAAGKGLTRAGVALSSTGLGAIVGVPLAAVGGGLQAGGKATKVAGRQARRSGKRVSKIGKKRGSVAKIDVGATRATIIVISTGLGIFYLFQFFLGIAYLITFGIVGGLELVTEADFGGNFIAVIGSYVASSAVSALAAIANALGFDIGGIFIISFALSLLWGLITLLTLSLIYLFQGLRPLSGEGAGVKNIIFLFTLISYIIPILNMLPVFILWALAVWKYPK